MQEEGIDLPAINALAQTTDGYLWLGTGTGLIRFDGMRFTRWEPRAGEKWPDDEVRYLLASPDGALWIRTMNTISRFVRGRLERYPEADSWLNGRNRAIAEDHAGTLWLVRASDPPEVGALLRNGTFRVYGRTDGLPERSIQNIFEDRSDNLWLSTDREICRWSPGRPAECRAFPRVGTLSIAGGAAADLLLGDDLEPMVRAMGDPSLTPKCAARDRDGNIWIGTLGQGLLRSKSGKLDRFTRLDGLSSDSVLALFEDRERDLWVVTARGLDRFRDPQVLRVSTVDGLSSDQVTAVQGTRDGSAWVGTLGGGLNLVNGNRAARYQLSSLLPSANILSLFEDTSQRLWIGTTDGFGYCLKNRFIQIRSPDGSPLTHVFAITSDPGGAIWVADGKLGLFVLRSGVAQPFSLPGMRATGMYQVESLSDGALWIGYYDGGVAVVHHGTVRNFTTRDGLADGPIWDLAEDRSGTVWVGARDALSRYRNGVWTTWDTTHGVPDGGVWGIIEDNQDTLWFMTSRGLARLSLEALNQSPDGAPRKLQFTLYGQSDGIRLAANPRMTNPRSSRSSDGRLWISTDDGVAIVDASLIRRNPLPPPVVVEEIVVDGKPLDLSSGAELPFRGRQVHITYTGLSLLVPERVRFRYKFEGLDHDETDAGTRRNVDYVNLPPGHYRFRVTACNNDGVWSPTGATLAFRIEPYFYQTKWFAGLCILGLALIAWGIHRLRVRMIMTRYEATVQERVRLTRELHDSLLQGFVGVVYQLEAAARQFECAPELGKQRLERAIEQADRALAEARQAMLAMRLPALEKSTLPEALSATAGGLTEGTDIDFHLDVRGRVRQLPYDAQANIFLIGREAIVNSVNHAHATTILAGLTYSEKHVRLTVQDDGAGFDLETVKAKHDHWGMAGMRERAVQIGATFSVCSSLGQGTKVEVVVPCKH